MNEPSLFPADCDDVAPVLATGGEIADADLSGRDLRRLLAVDAEQPRVSRRCDLSGADLAGARLTLTDPARTLTTRFPRTWETIAR